MTEDIRKIVTTRVIDDLRPIEGADRIELAVVGGWHVVVRKGEFEPGEEVFYFEIIASSRLLLSLSHSSPRRVPRR